MTPRVEGGGYFSKPWENCRQTLLPNGFVGALPNSLYPSTLLGLVQVFCLHRATDSRATDERISDALASHYQ